MSTLGKWRILEMPTFPDDYIDMVEPAYILFGTTHGKFVFGCVVGAFKGDGNLDAVEFHWTGKDELDRVTGKGRARLRPDGSMAGTISIRGDDKFSFSARRWDGSSTAC